MTFRNNESQSAAHYTSIETPIARVKPLQKRGQWILAGVLLLIAVSVVRSVVRNPRFGWPIVGEYLFSSQILDGLLITLYLTAIAMVIGMVLGTGLALMRLSANPILTAFSSGYVWLLRGTPPLVQLIFLYNISALYPDMSVSVPFGPTLWHVNANDLITPMFAAIVALSLNEAAYMCEIIKAGIISVPSGQREAGRVLGMTNRRIMARIVLPQSMRFIVPPTANQFIQMLKMTSLVSVIALSDLLYSAQLIYTRDFTTIPLLVVVVIWYLVVTTVLTVVQRQLERYYGKSDRNTGPRSRMRLWFSGISRWLRPEPNNH